MKLFRLSIVFIFILSFVSVHTNAQDFVYSPKNPAFGGSYLNYQWMLSSANAQNKLKAESQQPSYGGYYDQDPVQNFQQNLERKFFSQLSSEVINSYFGEGDGQQLEEGNYRFGNYEVEVFGGQRGLNIRIEDFQQGSETTITLPYY